MKTLFCFPLSFYFTFKWIDFIILQANKNIVLLLYSDIDDIFWNTNFIISNFQMYEHDPKLGVKSQISA